MRNRESAAVRWRGVGFAAGPAGRGLPRNGCATASAPPRSTPDHGHSAIAAVAGPSHRGASGLCPRKRSRALGFGALGRPRPRLPLPVPRTPRHRA